MEIGETFTLSGSFPNQSRKWWQFWKPRYVEMVQPFKVTHVAPPRRKWRDEYMTDEGPISYLNAVERFGFAATNEAN